MQQHPVPQDVTGFQFKLIGDMTVKQFVFLAAGTLAAYFLYRSVPNPIIKWPLALGVFFLGFAFAFMPLEDRPLDRWFGNFLKIIYAPTIFLWRKSSDIPEMLLPLYAPIPKPTSQKMYGGVSKKTMEEYVQSISNNSSVVDQDEQLFLQKIHEEFKRQYEETTIEETTQTTIDITSIGIDNRQKQLIEDDNLATISSPTHKMITVSSGGNQHLFSSIGQIKIRPLHFTKHKKPEIKTETHTLPPLPKPVEEQPKTKTEEENNAMNAAVENLTKQENQPQIIHLEQKAQDASTSFSSDVETIDLKGKEGVKSPNTIELEDKIEKLESDIAGLTKSGEKAADFEGEKLKIYLKELQEKLTKALSERQSLEEQLAKQRTENKKTEEVVVPTETMKVEKKEEVTVKFIPSQMAAKIGVVQPVSPNIISGIVKDNTDDILPGILIEIKDKGGKTERALKTNKLGQFAIATPLDNGAYNVYFEDPRGLYQFDIIEVNLTGAIFPAMEIKAKNQKDGEREKLREALFGKSN